MKKFLCVLLVVCIIVSMSIWDIPEASAAEGTISAADIVLEATALVGKYPYVWGGKSPADGGFDCTGLIYYVYHTRLGYNVTYDQLYRRSVGTRITNKEDFQVGDIVYGNGHVGIYVDKNTMIDSGSSKGVVRRSILGTWFGLEYAIRLPGITQGTTSAPEIAESTPNVSAIEDGKWYVEIPASYKLLLYPEASSSTSATYVSARSASYSVVCSQKATLSNGTVRYYGVFNTDDHYWLTYSNGMTIEEPGATASAEETSKKCIVTFDPRGGSVSPASVTVETPGRYNNLPTPTRDGYAFEGWYTDPDGGREIIDSNTLWSSESHTLYAHWTEVKPAYCEITFDANGGTVNWSTRTVASDGVYGALPVAANGDLNFVGWYTEKVGGQPVEATDRLIKNSDHTLYAHWNDIYSAMLDPNGGTILGSSSPIKSEYRHAESMPVPVRDGYLFDGWYTEKTGGERATGWHNFGGAAYFYAHWTPVATGTCVVTFDTQGGMGSGGSMEVTIGGTYSNLPIIMGKWGFEGTGWYTAPVGGKLILEGDPLISNTDHTLYAHYEQIFYVVTLDPNSGFVPMQFTTTLSSEPQEYTVSAKIQTYGDLPTPVWEGHGFLGWYTAPSGGELVANESSLVVQGNHTLYAHWL